MEPYTFILHSSYLSTWNLRKLYNCLSIIPTNNPTVLPSYKTYSKTQKLENIGNNPLTTNWVDYHRVMKMFKEPKLYNSFLSHKLHTIDYLTSHMGALLFLYYHKKGTTSYTIDCRWWPYPLFWTTIHYTDNITTTNILWNSILSTQNAKFSTIYISNFYLG